VVSVARDDYRFDFDRYLIVLDECCQPSEGGLEWAKPICRLFRNIEEYLGALRGSLLPRWENRNRQRAGLADTYKTHSHRFEL
jgi:hypothetical protein